MQASNLSIERISNLVHIIRGVVDGKFFQRTYVGCTKDQAIKKITNALQKGEI